jgi:uncharacterized protein (DUF488 family)
MSALQFTPVTESSRIFTIGHGVLSLDAFLQLLNRHGVGLVVDVRSHPGSQRAPHFNRRVLERILRERELGYRWEGETLGGRPSPDLLTASGAPDYERMVALPRTRASLDVLADEARRTALALMCSETDPNRCHRSRMLEPELEARGVAVDHILSSGALMAVPTLFG